MRNPKTLIFALGPTGLLALVIAGCTHDVIVVSDGGGEDMASRFARDRAARRGDASSVRIEKPQITVNEESST